MIIEGAERLPSGVVAYRVNIKRFDQFFDSLSRALYFERYGRPLDSSKYYISHLYLSLRTKDQANAERKRRAASQRAGGYAAEIDSEERKWSALVKSLNLKIE
jgi:hypothetical protein